MEEMDLYCEHQGFVFHVNGRGKWGKDPYWTFGSQVEFCPVSGQCVITAPLGRYTGRVARKVEMHYGFRPEKALSMAMQGKWWREITWLSQMTNRLVGEAAHQVMEGIEKGTID